MWGRLERAWARDWLALVKFSHTLFALPFALVSTIWSFSSGGAWSWWTFILVVLCMVFARNAAMGYNRLADRAFDAANPRTCDREIPRGAIGVRAAGWFVVLNALLFVVCAWFLNWVAFSLSPIALLMLLGYSRTKRFTFLCHFWLGATLGLAPLGAAVAVVGHFGLLEVLLGSVVLFWVAGFDIVYSLHDEAFDRAQGLHSVPSRLGGVWAVGIARGSHALSLVLLAMTLWYWGRSFWAWMGFLLFFGILIWQHTGFSHRNIARVDARFMLLNGINSVILSSFIMLDIIQSQVFDVS